MPPAGAFDRAGKAMHAEHAARQAVVLVDVEHRLGTLLGLTAADGPPPGEFAFAADAFALGGVFRRSRIGLELARPMLRRVRGCDSWNRREFFSCHALVTIPGWRESLRRFSLRPSHLTLAYRSRRTGLCNAACE